MRIGRRSGLTLIELLMVVIIIAMMVGMLLPAIQSARGRVKSIECTNNLLQLGIAIGNYASTHLSLPSGVVNDQGPILNSSNGYHHGWAVQILPFIEQGNLHRKFNFNEGISAPSNLTAWSTSIRIYQCSADWSNRLMSYAGCHNDVELPIDIDNRGVLYLNSHLTYDEITDGLASTILLGEYRGGRGVLGWASGTRSSLRNTGHRINEPFLILPQTSVGATSVSINTSTSTFVGGFSSWHPGGAHFLLCNGSVRFIGERINRDVFQSLGNRSDGNLMSDDRF